jgi:hypothetical protein
MSSRQPYQLVSREWKKEDTVFEINGVDAKALEKPPSSGKAS